MCVVKTNINSASYQTILENYLLPSIDEAFNEDQYIFQQDLVLAHASKSPQTWLQRNNVATLDWPANSPDLNVIENVWGILKKKLGKMKPTNLQQLENCITTCWNEVTSDDCQRLVDSMPRRIQAVINAKGAATKY